MILFDTFIADIRRAFTAFDEAFIPYATGSTGRGYPIPPAERARRRARNKAARIARRKNRR